MPSQEIANHIERSLGDNESPLDLGAMVDVLFRLRRPFHLESNSANTETIGAWLICVLVRPKPAKYVEAMKQFRSHFSGITNNESKRLVFANSVLPASLIINRPIEDPRPSLFFTPWPLLEYLQQSSADSVQRSDMGKFIDRWY